MTQRCGGQAVAGAHSFTSGCAMARSGDIRIMLTATAYEFGWKTVLLAIATNNRDVRVAAAEACLEDRGTGAVPPDQDFDDADAFQLDDPEIADRLAADRGQPTPASAPGHAHLVFPMLGRLAR